MTEENKKLIKELISIETDECVEWPKCKDDCGYGIVYYNDGEKSKNVKVHRVTYIFANNIEMKDILGKDIHHLCENKSCLNPKHLQLLSTAEHRRKHGRFNEDEIKAIRLDKRFSYVIAREYGCGQTIIKSIKNKKFYAHIDPNGTTFSNPPSCIGKFSDDEIRSIRKDKRTYTIISKQYGCSKSLISFIKNKKSYANVSD